ncbi:hypothetical protein [Tsuneonella amylolytica]|uniref:hypothetical protein n=1 Tax=Tsuneonella amylolytica TaxID=2338327 RepID=UPI000EA8A0E9|nr:hypothetical protein [Tsuneonella amylolytica]
MGPLVFLIAQASAAHAAAASPPDIEIRAEATVRSLEVRSRGSASLTLTAEPGEAPPVEVERSAPAGPSSYRNLTIRVRGIARLAAPRPIAAIDTTTGETE